MGNREEQIAVANEIIRQLGGSRFRVMTGARDIFAHENGVSFKIPRTATRNHINYVRISLDPSDTYTVEFWKYRKMRGDKVAEYSMIYNDGLQQLFTSETGLHCHL